MLLRAAQIIGWCFVIAAVLTALYASVGEPASSGKPVIDYKDYVSILLTALGVMIAIGAVAAAFAAVWGFEFLRREMSRLATETAKKEVQAIVPGLVAEAMDFAEKSKAVHGDAVAEEYGREVDDGE
jgi:hypothetical protein